MEGATLILKFLRILFIVNPPLDSLILQTKEMENSIFLSWQPLRNSAYLNKGIIAGKYDNYGDGEEEHCAGSIPVRP